MVAAALDWHRGRTAGSRSCEATRSPPSSPSRGSTEIGAKLAELEAAQYAGEVTDRAGALGLLRR